MSNLHKRYKINNDEGKLESHRKAFHILAFAFGVYLIASSYSSSPNAKPAENASADTISAFNASNMTNQDLQIIAACLNAANESHKGAMTYNNSSKECKNIAPNYPRPASLPSSTKMYKQQL